MAVTKKSLISNSTSKKTTKKSSQKTAANPVAAAKLSTAMKFAKQVPGLNSTFKAY